MSIIVEPLAIDWKIDPGHTGNQHILRVCTNGRWKTEATIKLIDDEWFWISGEQVGYLGDCSEKDAVDFLWNHRGQWPTGAHHYFCQCDVCMAESEVS